MKKKSFYGLFLLQLVFVCSCDISEPQAGKKKEEEEIINLDQEYLLFVGNPGVGKSTLINSLLGENLVPVGVTIEPEFTNFFKAYTHGNKIYLDTPGLGNISTCKQAAKEIEKALKKNGKYRIFFVLSLEAGRVRPEDITTIKTVLDAIKTKEKHFNVIVNKLESEVRELLNQELSFEEIYSKINIDHKTDTIALLNLDLKMCMSGKKKPFLDLDENFKKFLYTDSHEMLITAKDIKPLEINNYEILKGKLETELNKINISNLSPEDKAKIAKIRARSGL